MAHVREIIATAFHVFALILTIVALVPAIAIGIWAVDREPPVSNLLGRFDRWDSINPPVALITWTGSRHRICGGTAFRWVFSDRPYNLNEVPLPPAGAAAQVGKGPDVWTVSVPIPREALETSRSHINLRVRVVWQCNPLHHYYPIVGDPPEIPIPLPTRTR